MYFRTILIVVVLNSIALAVETPAPRTALERAAAYAEGIYAKPTWRIISTQGPSGTAGLHAVVLSQLTAGKRLTRVEADYGTYRKLSLVRGDERWIIEPARSLLLAFEPDAWSDPRVDAELLTPHPYAAEESTWSIRPGTWRNQSTWQIDQALPRPAGAADGEKTAILRFHVRTSDFALQAREEFTRGGRLNRFFRIDAVDHPPAIAETSFAPPAKKPQVTVRSAAEFLTCLSGAAP